jgi:excisionase family DNA binding protein
MEELLTTKEMAQLLDLNEKVIYSLIAEKGLPATKVTGKWLFPKTLVERWIENSTINMPAPRQPLPEYHGLLIIAGSNDILLDRAITLFNKLYSDHIAVFGNLGSLGGLRAVKKQLCHMATSHLLQDDSEEYNFGFAQSETGQLPAIVNFCRREQCLLIAPSNPKSIQSISDLARSDIRIVNRPKGTGTRLLFDMELEKAGIQGSSLNGYDIELQRHMDVGVEILSGRADAGLGISAVAGLLGLDFIPLRLERYDLVIPKDRFFDRGVQLFLGMLHENAFRDLTSQLIGYDLSLCGKMVFPQNAVQKED